MIAAITAIGVAPTNGGRPASSSYMTTPRENTSVGEPTGSPLACSGDM